MKIAIVGAEGRKWNRRQEDEVKAIIREILTGNPEDTIMVSGRCPKGGVDIWAEEIAQQLNIKMDIFPPQINQWQPHGYKERNIQIAEDCDIMLVISPSHDWNGGRWTGKRAESLGKQVKYITIQP